MQARNLSKERFLRRQPSSIHIPIELPVELVPDSRTAITLIAEQQDNSYA